MHKSYTLLSLVLTLLPLQYSLAAFDSGRAGFSVTVNNENYGYRNFATYVLPGEQLAICINAADPEQYNIVVEAGQLQHLEACRWTWTAPLKKGQTWMRIEQRNNKDSIRLEIFVMTPASKLKNGAINGVRIGDYPPAVDDSPLYQIPDGFIKVTAANVKTAVSPHFVLGQFITPFDDRYPKYIVLRERLLLKLETLLERLNEKGYAADSLALIAGYMSPAFNRASGGTLHSRHIYGGAATIIIDEDADGVMDDLDNNGIIDDDDAKILFDIIDVLYGEDDKQYLRGGLFLYGKTATRGPAIMIDARGYRKRWRSESSILSLPEGLKAKHKRQFE